MKVDFLCLANSRKHGGRCVAGIRLDTKEWVRPVSERADGTLYDREPMTATGHVLRPLDRVTVDLGAPRPARHQPEDWLLGAGGFGEATPMPLQDAIPILDAIAVPGPRIFGGLGGRIPEAEVPDAGLAASLALVRVVAPRFTVRQTDEGPQLRAAFGLAGRHYDLPVTDLEPWTRTVFGTGGWRSYADWYFVISLTEPFKGTYFKLVAAGLPVLVADPAERVLRMWEHLGGPPAPKDAAERVALLSTPAGRDLQALPADALRRALDRRPRTVEEWVRAARQIADGEADTT